jgi:hypothetical protein
VAQILVRSVRPPATAAAVGPGTSDSAAADPAGADPAPEESG